MKRISLLAVFLFSVLLTQAAYAETIQGRVDSVNPADNSVLITRADKNDQIKVTLKDTTQFLGGVTSLTDLKSGDQVTVNADQNFITRSWKARSIEKSPTAAAATPSSAATTDTTSDTMGASDTTGTTSEAAPTAPDSTSAANSSADASNTGTPSDTAATTGSTTSY